MRLVIKIGGSLLFDKDQHLDAAKFQQYADEVRQIAEQGHKILLVVGGGALARTLVEQGRFLRAQKDALDQLGIAATWVCAQLMIAALNGLAYPTPMMTEGQIASYIDDKRILVVGGLKPGQSTNAVAARMAEITQANVLVNVTDVDGVFDKDPKRYTGAKLLAVVTAAKLRQIVSSLPSDPGTYPLFDKRALEIVERARIEVWFVNGQQSHSIVGAVTEKRIGTRLAPS
jgi:uridylate kinase